MTLPAGDGLHRPASGRRKTILLPRADAELRDFILAESPVPVEVVSDPTAALGPSDLAVVVVDSVDPALREAVTRLIADRLPYVVLVQRDLWDGAIRGLLELLDEVQRDPRRKLICFWRDRPDLERALCDEVFTLDVATLVGQSMRDDTFVKVGSTFEQTWELENTGFCPWERRALKELGSDGLRPERTLLPVSRTAPGERVSVTAAFTAPDEPASCRSVWQMIGADGRLAFPWAPGMWCQVRAVL